MRILWLSGNKGLYRSGGGTPYNGGGWIASLQKLFVGDGNELGFAFATTDASDKAYVDGNISYFPIYTPPLSRWAKLRQYYGGYKRGGDVGYASQVRSVLEKFRPDVTHLFGLESPLATAVCEIDTTKIVHLQGLLSPVSNAFFPPGINEKSFIWPATLREWVLRNGYVFAKKSMAVRGEREYDLFKKFRHFMGRTEWDYRVSRLLSPSSTYYKVDEVLRDAFYLHAGQWRGGKKEPFTIISTLSDTVYKGLDLVLKTARLLKRTTSVDFKWQVVGIKASDGMVGFFERELGIKGSDVGVEYIGVKDEQELCDLLLQGSVFVHPSYIDNSPNSVCEAQMLGLPVIGCAVGGVPSLIRNGETGCLVPANAPFELAYLLREMDKDEALCQRLGRNAYETAMQRHDREKIKRDLLNAYTDACHK